MDNSASTDSPRQRIKEKSQYGNSVSTPHRRYGHRLRTPSLRTPFPRLLWFFSLPYIQMRHLKRLLEGRPNCARQSLASTLPAPRVAATSYCHPGRHTNVVTPCIPRGGPKGVSMKRPNFPYFRANYTVVSKGNFEKSPWSWIPLLWGPFWSFPNAS